MSMPAGWYDDGSGRQRWWDGQKWTDQFASDQAAPTASAPAPNRAQVTVLSGRVAPVMGFIGLGLAVVGTVLACIPAAFIVGVVVLIAAFVLSLVGLFKKNVAKWPSIFGLILSLVGGAIGTVVTLAIVAASIAGPAPSVAPIPVPSAAPTSMPASPTPTPSEPPMPGTDEGRPSPETISELLGQVTRDGGTTAYDDMPDFFPCMGKELYDSDVDDQTLWLLIRGAESLGAGHDTAAQAMSDAVLTCDPNGEGAWG